jgi:micrococcal nuclease
MRRRYKIGSLLLALLAAFVLLARRTSAPGRVSLPAVERREPLPQGKARITEIVDGDTVHALISTTADAAPVEEKVRLYGINAPELHPRPGQRKDEFQVQPCAVEARDFLAALCPPGSEIKVELHERDKYGRVLAVLILADGRDVSHALIEAGLAKAYFFGSKKEPLRLQYEEAQEHAQKAASGIWRAAKEP